MQSRIYPPYHRVHLVESFDELIETPFTGEINAMCWVRSLNGDFSEIITQLQAAPGITAIEDRDLRCLELSQAGALARDVLLRDQALLRERGLAPSLECITGYPRDEASGPITTDVYSFHVDSAPVQADTYLCTYVGASSEGLVNEGAVRQVDVPETRAALLERYGGAEDAAFTAYLAEHHYDLHYVQRPGFAPYSFGVGHLWRIAIATPDSSVLPCIHRAPVTEPGAQPRLLLIS